jgi:cobaltochelatase CobN
MPEYGLYLPYRGIYNDLDDYKKAAKFDSSKPTVGILLYGGMHFDDTRPMAEALYENLMSETNLIIVFSDVMQNLKSLNLYMDKIDIFVNLQFFQINGGPMGGDPELTYEFFQNRNVPYLISLRGYETDIQKWSDEDEGLNPMEVILGVTLPELDGAIEPVFTSGLETNDDPDLGEVRIIGVVPERIEKLTKRILNWIKLRKKDNSEKKIAILTYNYPSGEENLANAGYLDVFESLEVFLNKLKEENYSFEVPRSKLKDLFLSRSVLNSPNYLKKSGIMIDDADYREWFYELPLEVQEAVTGSWGEPPGDIMVKNDHFLIPGIEMGNLFLGVQPSRGVHEDPQKAYHDKELPPHHQYLAFYYYLEHHFLADAVLHFGTHGTLEFTPGKEVGMSSKCYPDILIGNLPNLYYYWVGNTSESTIAKRRSYAQCISHASPNMKSSDLYEDYLILEELIEQFNETEDQNTLILINNKSKELHLPENVEDISRELYRMKRRLIPDGLHIMNKKPKKDELNDYLLGVLRIEREYPSILQLTAENDSKDWKTVNDFQKEKIESKARIVINEILEGKTPDWLPEGYIEVVYEIMNSIFSSSESDGLLNALDGSYIIPARGGDPIRDPDVYPTGRAMYAFDPRQIPTVTAYSRGKTAADLIIKSYLEKHEKYPQRVGIVLWGFETLKTGGDTISTILSLMGVKMKHQKGAWIKKIEIIPLDELKRPRIDVAITICGIFRDTLGTQIDLINRALKMVSELDEPPEMNYIRKNYLEEIEELNDTILARIFGPAPTEYATSMRTLVENSSWEDEEELAESYEDSMSYAYLPGEIKRNIKGFGKILENVDVVAQERDNTEYEVTDLDHYYEFLGGLSRTIQSKKGEQAEIFVVDSTEEEVYIEDVGLTIERATRTRLLNPKWIDGMLKHDFHGAKNIKDRMEYLLGFAATTGKVNNWVFENVADKLVLDEDMRQRIINNNPYAAVKMGELLIESNKRGYWDTEENKLDELKDIVLNMESEIE